MARSPDGINTKRRIDDFSVPGTEYECHVADRGENLSIISCLFLLLNGFRNLHGMIESKDVGGQGKKSEQSICRFTGVQQISL